MRNPIANEAEDAPRRLNLVALSQQLARARGDVLRRYVNESNGKQKPFERNFCYELRFASCSQIWFPPESRTIEIRRFEVALGFPMEAACIGR